MALASPWRLLLPILIASLPALYCLWSGWRLRHRLETPALPELLQQRLRNLLLVSAVSLVSLVLFSGPLALAWVAWLVLLALIAGYPFRRRLYGETWSLPRYLSHILRFYLALVGPVWLMALALYLQLSFAAPAPVVYVLVGSAIGWMFASAPILRWLLDAHPLDADPLADSDLVQRLEQISSAARCRPPRIFVLPSRGGHFMNAFALFSVGPPEVVLSEGLLRHLDRPEVTAIFAHEVAHLEHHTPRRVLARNTLVAIVMLVVASLFGHLPDSGWWTVLLLIGLLALFLVWASTRLRQSRRHEAQSDQRAAELCGDPEALISGLVKLHRLARLPRRVAASVEDASTHPSLAARVRRLRQLKAGDPQAASIGPAFADSMDGEGAEPGSPSPMFCEPVMVQAEKGRWKAVVLDAEAVHFVAELPGGLDLKSTVPGELSHLATRAATRRYSDLVELRVDLRRGRPGLLAVDGWGKSFRADLAAADIEKVQQTLDCVDVEVGTALQPPAKRPIAGRLLAAVGLALAVLPPFSAAVAITAVLALLRPGRRLLAALAVAAGAAALIMLLRPMSVLLETPGVRIAASLHLLLALGLAAMLRRRRSSQQPAPRPLLVVGAILLGLGLCYHLALLGASVLAASAGLAGWSGLLQLARHASLAAVYPVPLAYWLGASRSRWRRALACVAVVLAVVFFLAGSEWTMSLLSADSS